jgi:electron transfer flavoprotein beta subunit
MNILVCIKRVPATGGKVTLTSDEQEIDTRFLGFTISPHEECAVEEAVRLTERHGGSAAVLTLGPEATLEQLRDSMAMGVERAVLLETDGREWDAAATAAAIVEAVRAEPAPFDLILFGNESADTGNFQVGIRVAQALDWPCITGVNGVKSLEIEDGAAVARREVAGGWEVFSARLPAVITVKEGINLPRYPSFQGRIKAKKKDIPRLKPEWKAGGLEKIRLRLPPAQDSTVEILGNGPEAASKAVELFKRLGMV